MTPPKSTLPLALWTLVLIGCDGGPPRVPRFPAEGTVLVGGRPAAGVRVTFHPADRLGDLDALRPTGVSGEDGVYRLGTYETGDGAPTGRYRITLFYPDEPPTGANSPNDRLGGKYLDAGRSTLEAEVVEGENRIPPIEVKEAAKPPRTPPRRPAKPDFDGVG